MYLVKIIKSDIKWLINGKTYELNNESATRLEREGVLEIIKYLGKQSESEYYKKKQVKRYKEQIEELKIKIKRIEKELEDVIKWKTKKLK